ncbi:MAG: hypothetical protein WC076_11815 [Terrimicrobiaceae bacterium]|nr:hypothetical protein [Terrimicrobiaceae bacterium]
MCVVLAVVGLASCSKPASPKPDAILLHSGRIRGNVYPASLQDISPLQYYPYLAGYIQKVREEAKAGGAQVFVVDLGDSLGGSFAAHVTGSQNMTAFFNGAGYDAIMLSNLDASVPESAIREFHGKVLSPFQGPVGTSPMPPAGARLEKGGTTLFFLSNFYGNTEPSSQPGRFPTSFGPFKEGVRPVRDYSGVLKSLGPKPEKSLTVFGWMKFEPAAKPPEALLGNLRELGVDAILAHRIYGHKEREAWQANGFVDWKPPVSLNILRNNGGFAIARLDLAREGRGWKVLRHELVPMTANNTPADAKMIAEIEKFSGVIQAADSPLCELPAPVGMDRILDIYMAALATVPGTNAVAYSGESIRSDWRTGTLRASAVFNSIPWNTGLVQIKLTPGQLQSLAEAKILRVAKRTDDGGPVFLTTSKFFSQLIAQQPHLENVEVVELPQTSEFDFFLDYLKANPGAIFSGPAPGWSILTPP